MKANRSLRDALQQPDRGSGLTPVGSIAETLGEELPHLVAQACLAVGQFETRQTRLQRRRFEQAGKPAMEGADGDRRQRLADLLEQRARPFHGGRRIRLRDADLAEKIAHPVVGQRRQFAQPVAQAAFDLARRLAGVADGEDFPRRSAGQQQANDACHQ